MSTTNRSIRAFIRFFLRREQSITAPGTPFNITDALANSSFQPFRSGNPMRSSGKLTPQEEQFLQRMTRIVMRHVSDPDFDTRVATKEAGLSRMHVNRRLRATTGCSTHNFICALRFRRARELLRESSLSVCDVARAVGFRSASHFAKVFRKRFGLSPSEFVKEEMLRHE
jgi:transcriptional regulator GlxA family with amidase domain